jgi:uncharacterized protein (TIGR02594 family)
MYRCFAFRSPLLIALALGSVATVATTPASARQRHHHHAVHAHHHAHHHAYYNGYRHAHVRHRRGATMAGFGQSTWGAEGASGWQAKQSFAGGGTSLVAEARRYIGGNPTGLGRLWCARFMNMVLERSGHRGSGSDMARSFASYGQRISGPQVGAIAVMSRGRRGGHVGVVSGIDPNGNPIVVSGNHGRRVAESVYPRGRIYAYVLPSS